MGKKSYLGGHTIVGPESGWFTKKIVIEDHLKERSEQEADDWRQRVRQVQEAYFEDIDQIEHQRRVSLEKQEAIRARLKAKRQAKKADKASKNDPPRKNMERWLKKADPDLARQVSKVFRGKP